MPTYLLDDVEQTTSSCFASLSVGVEAPCSTMEVHTNVENSVFPIPGYDSCTDEAERGQRRHIRQELRQKLTDALPNKQPATTR